MKKKRKGDPQECKSIFKARHVVLKLRCSCKKKKCRHGNLVALPVLVEISTQSQSIGVLSVYGYQVVVDGFLDFPDIQERGMCS